MYSNFYQIIPINNRKWCSIGTDFWDYLFSVAPKFSVVFWHDCQRQLGEGFKISEA